MRFILLFALFSTLLSCSSPSTTHTPEIKTGIWRGTLNIQGQELPFNFEVEKDSAGGLDFFLRNASERLLLDEVYQTNDSVRVVLHVFDAEIRAVISNDSLNGLFILNYAAGYRLPFKAKHGQAFRFSSVDKKAKVENDFSGKYKVTFTSESGTTESVGVFRQEGNYAEGSFLTTTGDYRYLEGGVHNDTLMLSTFDGNHLYLFKAVKNSDGTLSGFYWSGKTLYKTWTGVPDANASLPDSESIVSLKPGYDRIEFSFPDVNGKIIASTDERFRNKVVILQILGTWCPNCMDETKFLIPWYNENKDRGVEILGLAYERKDDFNYAAERVKKMQQKWNVPYDIVIAGVNDNVKAAETLPALTRLAAFPTTIFVGKDGKVKHIHTGFEGPGTGAFHEQFKERFNETINEMLSEKI